MNRLWCITLWKYLQPLFLIFIQKLDYESKRVYTVKVEVTNTHQDPNFFHLGPFSDTAIIKVTAKDVDEPPIFSRPQYVFEVNEDTPKGAAIGTITAWDPDATDYPIQWALEIFNNSTLTAGNSPKWFAPACSSLSVHTVCTVPESLNKLCKSNNGTNTPQKNRWMQFACWLFSRL